MTNQEFISAIAEVQRTLNAPKNQFNSFGKYKYRSCEDILEGLKKVLGELVVTVSDDIVMVGDRIYVKATATVTDGENSLSNTAFARESLNKKGMDESQITGTASSYSRKYALNGLFLIDDSQDADAGQVSPTDEYLKEMGHCKNKNCMRQITSRIKNDKSLNEAELNVLRSKAQDILTKFGE